MGPSLRSLLPEVYGTWLPELFDHPALAEPRATCASCAMCGKGPVGDAFSSSSPEMFRPDIKCCTWHPALPNYLVGAALRDVEPSLAPGRERLRAKIAARVGVGPLQIAPPPKYTVLYAFLVQEDPFRETSFGHADELVCPYFERDGGTCSIWPYRERVCATWFCKTESRAGGYAVWRSLKEYLGHVQDVVAREAAAAVLGFALPPVAAPSDVPMTTAQLAGERSEAEYAADWGAYLGREEAFYVACAEYVERLARADVASRLDSDGGRELLERASAAYDAVQSPKLAPRLVLRRDTPAVPVAGGVEVHTYSRFDPVFAPQSLYELLQQFSAEEATTTTLAKLRARTSELHESVLLQLQVYGVMVPP